MSIRTELEDVVKWISELMAKDQPDPKPKPLPREQWQRIDADLRRAAEKLALAHGGLPSTGPHSFLAELARDLAHEAEALALRAHLLSRRAMPQPKAEVAPPHVPAPAGGPKASRAEARGETAGGASAPGEQDHAEPADATQAKDRTREPARQTPAQLIGSAGDTVETAHQKLGTVGARDPVSKVFADELDVLAEMILSLRQQSEQLEDEMTPRQAGTR
jgi:hypothetical protein